MEKRLQSKDRFRIGDLANELKIKKFVIRFWEKEFGLRSDRSEGGQRYYSNEDLKMFFKIKELLYKRGFTIAGARQQLKEMKGKISFSPSKAIKVKEESRKDQPDVLADKKLIKTLAEVKKGLISLREKLQQG